MTGGRRESTARCSPLTNAPPPATDSDARQQHALHSFNHALCNAGHDARGPASRAEAVGLSEAERGRRKFERHGCGDCAFRSGEAHGSAHHRRRGAESLLFLYRWATLVSTTRARPSTQRSLTQSYGWARIRPARRGSPVRPLGGSEQLCRTEQAHGADKMRL